MSATNAVRAPGGWPLRPGQGSRLSVGDELIRAVLTRAAAAFALAADHVAARRDAAAAVLWVDEVGGAGDGERAEGEAGPVADAGGPPAGTGIGDQGVRVPARCRAEHVDPRDGDLAPVRGRRDGDVGEVIERDDDQVALCLQAVDNGDGHLALEVAEDVKAGAFGKIGESERSGHGASPLRSGVAGIRGLAGAERLRCGGRAGYTGLR